MVQEYVEGENISTAVYSAFKKDGDRAWPLAEEKVRPIEVLSGRICYLRLIVQPASMHRLGLPSNASKQSTLQAWSVLTWTSSASKCA